MCFKIPTRGSGFENIEILKTCINSFNPKLNNKLKDVSNQFNVQIEWLRPRNRIENNIIEYNRIEQNRID